jgi:hypothetical protein
MASEKPEQPGKIILLANQSQDKKVTESGFQSDIQIYKAVISEKFILATTAEEYEKLLNVRQKIQELDIEDRRLDYAQQSAEIKLKDARQRSSFQRIQQAAASLTSISIGIYFLQALPLAGLLFLILGLAKPLGYSLGEISEFLDGLKGFSKDSEELVFGENGKEAKEKEISNEGF